LQHGEEKKDRAAADDGKRPFYEYLDYIANTELKSKSALQGATRLRYDAARSAQGGPLTQAAAQRVLRALRPGTVVLLTTGTGNPVWLPHGETDGPSGVAVLARLFTNLGHRVCLLSEAHYLPGIRASVAAAGVPFLHEENWRQRSIGALAIEAPLGRAAGERFFSRLLDDMPEAAAAFFVEKPGPNIAGVAHNSSGKEKAADTIAHLDLLADLARSRGLMTGAVGDGGNEIGFGAIRKALSETHPYGKACGCRCGRGIINATEVDVLFPAAVSNWGAYAIAAAVALNLDRPTLMPPWREVKASIMAPLSHGAFDGYSGLSVPSVDGTSLETNRAVYQLICEVIRLAGTPAH